MKTRYYLSDLSNISNWDRQLEGIHGQVRE